MKDLEVLTARFAERLNSLMPSLGPLNAIDVHIDEALGYRPPAEEQIAASVTLLGWIMSNLAETLAGKVVMLLIPLRNSAVLEQAPPAWDSLASQLSATPPSIYVMAPTAFLQPDPAERFIAAIEAPIHDEHTLAAYYQCWRNPGDPVEDGWARDVRIVFTGFLRA